MKEDKRTKCNDCEDYLCKGEMVHLVKYGYWNTEDFRDNEQTEYYCRECWSERSPMREGINLKIDSAKELVEILSSSDGKLVADFNSHIIGSRVFMRIAQEQSEFAYVKSRVTDSKEVGMETEYRQKSIDEALEFTKDSLIQGNRPPIIVLSQEQKTPFDEYPKLDEGQESIDNF